MKRFACVMMLIVVVFALVAFLAAAAVLVGIMAWAHITLACAMTGIAAMMIWAVGIVEAAITLFAAIGVIAMLAWGYEKMKILCTKSFIPAMMTILILTVTAGTAMGQPTQSLAGKNLKLATNKDNTWATLTEDMITSLSELIAATAVVGLHQWADAAQHCGTTWRMIYSGAGGTITGFALGPEGNYKTQKHELES